MRWVLFIMIFFMTDQSNIKLNPVLGKCTFFVLARSVGQLFFSVLSRKTSACTQHTYGVPLGHLAEFRTATFTIKVIVFGETKID